MLIWPKKWNIIKIGKEILTLDNIKIKKKKKKHIKRILLFLETQILKKLLVSKMIFVSDRNYKYFIGYLYDNYKIAPL